jgi:hypothetical protein
MDVHATSPHDSTQPPAAPVQATGAASDPCVVLQALNIHRHLANSIVNRQPTREIGTLLLVVSALSRPDTKQHGFGIGWKPHGNLPEHQPATVGVATGR